MFIKRGNLSENRSAQVWVETVIYTLIGLAIIGILLAVAKPKIDEMKDKAVIEQSIDGMDKINDKIYAVQRATGNKRAIDMNIDKGRFVIDTEKDEIRWEIESEYKYSEPGSVVNIGNMEVLTEEAGPWVVNLKMRYNVDIWFNNKDIGTKEFEKSPSPYTFYIENIGRQGEENNIVININE